MQFIKEAQQKAAQLLADNATTLLTAGGVIGVVGTAVLAARGGMKYTEVLIIEKENLLAKDLDRQEAEGVETLKALPPQVDTMTKIKLAAPYFLPPMITGTATVVAIIFSHRMSAQKAAALAAAYGLAERNFGEYREKVQEKLTGPKAQAVDDELAQDRVSRSNGFENIVVVEGEVLCYDEPTARYFKSTMENIKAAVNATNAEIIHHDHASATFFYEEIGLPGTTWTDEVGWNADHLLDLKISTVMSPDNRPCIAIDFKVLPKQDYVPKHY